jgi:hypothetical protein
MRRESMKIAPVIIEDKEGEGRRRKRRRGNQFN